MKKRVFLSLLLVLVLISLDAISQGTVFLTQGFDGGTFPSTWKSKKIVGTKDWKVQRGGGAYFETPELRHPLNAHSGGYNITFQVEGVGPSARLESPPIDLRFTDRPVLSFWLAQDERNNTDELKVYYRINSTSSWQELAIYINTLSDWTYKEIVLPEEAKVQYFQLGFVAKSNDGWGVCLDDIKVDERSFINRTVSSVTTYQIKDILPTNTTVNPIVFTEIVVMGNTNNIYFTNATYNYTGTNISDVTNFKLFYSRDSVFTNSNPLPFTANKTGNTIQFSGAGQQELSTGLNYIWICADISPSAPHGNIVDLSLPINGLTVSSIQFPSVAQNPTGNCKIEESIVVYDFESPGGWTLTNTWAFGTKTVTNQYDPPLAYAGSKVLSTNLLGNYPPNLTEADAYRATTLPVNAKYYQNIKIKYKKWLSVETTDIARVWFSSDNGVNWLALYENGSTILDNSWKSVQHDLLSIANRKENIMVRFSIDESDGSTEYGGWNIDNFAITGDFIANDVGVNGITAPISHCGMGNEPVTVTIKNYGGATINTPFEVGFSIDNGITYTKQLINPTIAVDGEYIHTFTATANLATPGLKQLKFKTFLTGDEDTKNDLYSTTLQVYPTNNYNYANSFETSNGYWYPSGTNSSWAWGIVAKATINKASDGTKVWTTGGLKSVYNNSELSYLESPCFDFTNAEYPVFSFDYFINSENEKDGLRLEYKIEGETSWTQVNANSNYNLGWSSTYVTSLASNGWTGNTATDYQMARTLLPSAILGKNNVKFRFVFASDNNYSLDGVAIDNIKIYELPYDVGVFSLTNPTSGCLIGLGKDSVNLDVEIKNFGYRPLKTDLKIPIEIKLRNDDIVKDSLKVVSLINQNGTATLTTTKKFWIISKGKHTLRLNTNFSQDLDRSQDTLKPGLLTIPFKTAPFELEVKGIPGYTLGADKAVVNPFPASISVEIDAGLNGLNPYNNYLWSTTETTRKITVTSYGTYSVTVTNENSCTATDAIDIIEATSDIQVLSDVLYTGLNDACEQNSTIYPKIKIKNVGPGRIGFGYTVNSIPLSIMVDGIVKVNETFTFQSPKYLGVGRDTSFTFTTGINIPIAKTYDIRIYSKINEDPDKSNDTLKITSNVWGMPDVNFPQDTIISLTAASSVTLDAGLGFATYKWQDNSNLQTFDVSSDNSAWYKVTVTDIHSCGSDKDSVYINAKDLSLISIQNPIPSFCNNEHPVLVVVVNNSGKDDFSTNEKITISYTTPEESISKEFTLFTPMLTGTSRPFTFDNPVKLPDGEGFISVKAKIKNDPTSSNDILERAFERRLSPTVSFDPTTLYKVFGDGSYTVSPIYSEGVKSFAWKSSSWALLTTDSLFTIYNTPPGRTLNIIAYERQNQDGCRDTATLSIIADDIALNAIKLPGNKCALENNTLVEITIENKGNFTYPTGTIFTTDIDVDGVHKFTESFDITSDLAPNAKRDIPLNNKLDLLNKTFATIQASITTAVDVVSDNNFLNKTVYSTGYPSVNIGTDRTIHEWKDTIRTVGKFQSYQWLYNGNGVGTDSIFIATQSGNYKVNVTDFNGCPGTSNQITLTFVVDDISLKTLDKPQTGCGLTLNEPVRVTVENTGSEVINSGQQLRFGFKQIAPPNTLIATGTQNFTLSSNLASGQTRSFDLTNTMSFPNNIEYTVKVWVKTDSDMRSNNDTLFTTVRSYPPVLYNQFNVDTIETTKPDTTLDAGGGFNSYLWNTGTTTRTINVNTSGKYRIEVSNANGCKAKDSVYVKFLHDLSVESLITPLATNCSLSTTQTITVRLKNLGNNIIPLGTSIPITLKIASSLVATENLLLTNNLAVGATIDYTFTYKPNLSAVGDYLLEITSKLKNDNTASNNTLAFSVRTQGTPILNLGLDRIISTPTVLDAGSGYSSYLWSTSATTQTITVNASGTYSVTVTDANGCQGSDAVTLTWQEVVDVQATALTSPTTNCFKSEGQTVTLILKNFGSSTLTSGQNIDVSYQINTNTPVVQTLTLSSNLGTNQTVNFTFNQKAILNPGTYTFYLKTIINGVSGTVTNYPVIINSNPIFSFQNHIVKTTLPYTITSNISNVNYLWNTGSSNASITVSSYGKYWLTVSDKTTGCGTTDTISIENPTSVGTIPGSNAKVTYFPNPVNNELTVKIETDKQEVFNIDLVNPSGQIIKNIKSEKTLFFIDKIDVNGFNPGLYLLKVGNGKDSAVFKVIIQH